MVSGPHGLDRMHVGRDFWCGALGGRVARGGGEGRCRAASAPPSSVVMKGGGGSAAASAGEVLPSQRLGRAEAGPGSGVGGGEGGGV